MIYKGLIKRSHTMDYAALLATFGVIQQLLPMIEESLAGYYGYVFMAVGIVVALLRQKTKGPVGEK